MFIEQLESRRLLAALVITAGGTYGGKWDRITVNTTAPVVIDRATVTGPGDLIVLNSVANVTLNKVTGQGQPGAAGSRRGRFLRSNVGYSNLTVTKCTLLDTAGMDLYAAGRSGSTLRVTYNYAQNIIGQRGGRTGNVDGQDFDLVQFVQLNGAPGVDAEISNNLIINEPGLSRVEDNISIWQSSGTASRPIWIHHNYIEGAYKWTPTVADSGGFSGGGIIVDRGGKYCLIEDNIVRRTTNYGIAVAGGSNNTVRNNSVLMDETLPDSNICYYARNYYSADPFTNNVFTGNKAKSNNNNSYWLPGAASASNNTTVATIRLWDGTDYWHWDWARAA